MNGLDVSAEIFFGGKLFFAGGTIEFRLAKVDRLLVPSNVLQVVEMLPAKLEGMNFITIKEMALLSL